MPESPEVTILSEYLNQGLADCDVIRVEKSPICKNPIDLSVLEGKKWKLSSKSRGKEMMITLSDGEENHHIKVGFARIGNIERMSVDSLDVPYLDARGMLRFYTEKEVYFISDFTRYVIFRWSGEWDKNRSPDPLHEHNDWRDHLYRYRKIPMFQRPIYEIFTDQRFFNGIGNFSRTEILSRMRFSPFTPFSEVLESDIMRNELFETTRYCLAEIVRKGGLQHKLWKNPFGVPKIGMDKWIKSYSKKYRSYYIRDSKGRIFWFPKEWGNDFAVWYTASESADRLDPRLSKKIYSKTKRKK